MHFIISAACCLPHVVCCMMSAARRCGTLCAACCMPHGVCCTLSAASRLPHRFCCTLSAARCLLSFAFGVCCLLHGVCCAVSVTRCLLRVVCCASMLHVVRCVSYAAWCLLHAFGRLTSPASFPLHVVRCTLSSPVCLRCVLSAGCFTPDAVCCMMPVARWLRQLAACVECSFPAAPIAAERCAAPCASERTRAGHAAPHHRLGKPLRCASHAARNRLVGGLLRGVLWQYCRLRSWRRRPSTRTCGRPCAVLVVGCPVSTPTVPLRVPPQHQHVARRCEPPPRVNKRGACVLCARACVRPPVCAAGHSGRTTPCEGVLRGLVALLPGYCAGVLCGGTVGYCAGVQWGTVGRY